MTLTKGAKIGIAVGIVAVIVVVAFASFLIATGNGGVVIIPPSEKAELSIVTWDESRDTWGDARFTVTVTNTGELTGSKVLWCSVVIGENTYKTHQTITIAPADTRDYEPYIDLPIGTMFSSGTTYCWLEDDNVVYQ
jgi:hypothetical protein